MPDRFHLYRVFSFASEAKLYVLPGALSQTCKLNPVWITTHWPVPESDHAFARHVYVKQRHVTFPKADDVVLVRESISVKGKLSPTVVRCHLGKRQAMKLPPGYGGEVDPAVLLQGRTHRRGALYIVLEPVRHRNYLLESSHEFAGEEHLQLTLLHGGRHPIEDSDRWAEFEHRAMQLVPGLAVGQLAAARSRAGEQPVAFSVREFEGMMPNVETVHLAFAAAFFRHCGLSLQAPHWLRSSH